MATVTFNPSFYRNLSAALKEAAEDMDAAFEAVISSSIFPWPRSTRRRNGQNVSSPRDIVDTGDFRKSQSFSFPSALLARFVWDIEYAAIILYGYTTTEGGIYPGRDWIAETLRQVNAENILADALRRRF